MKVYLSGPMTGVEHYKANFGYYEKRLTGLGFTVFNPAWFDYKEGWAYDEILDLDLAALQKCEAIFMLPGWEKSKGACIEYGYALAKGINIMHVGYLKNAETWEKMHESIFPTCNNVLWKNDDENNKLGMPVNKDCTTCKHTYTEFTSQPCSSCRNCDNWEKNN